MRYLSTLLLTTTILTTTHVSGGLFCCKESKLREEKDQRFLILYPEQHRLTKKRKILQRQEVNL